MPAVAPPCAPPAAPRSSWCEGRPLLDAARVTPGAIVGAAGRALPRRPRTRPTWPPTRCTARSGWPPRDGAADGWRRGPDRTLVAMSGGVDSAAAAQLALDARRGGGGGHAGAVVGPRHRRRAQLLLAPGRDRRPRPGSRDGPPAPDARPARALPRRRGGRLPGRLRAPGATPNPCVRCNGLVRFDAMLELAARLGAATPGHRALRAHRPRRGGPAGARRRRPGQGPELRARPARLRTSWSACASRSASWRSRACASWPAPPGCRWPTSARARTCASWPARARARFMRRHGGGALRRGRGRRSWTATARCSAATTATTRFTVGQRRGIGVAGLRAALRAGQGRRRATAWWWAPAARWPPRGCAVAPALLHRPGAAPTRCACATARRRCRARVAASPPAGAHGSLALRARPRGGRARRPGRRRA